MSSISMDAFRRILDALPKCDPVYKQRYGISVKGLLLVLLAMVVLGLLGTMAAIWLYGATLGFVKIVSDFFTDLISKRWGWYASQPAWLLVFSLSVGAAAFPIGFTTIVVAYYGKARHTLIPGVAVTLAPFIGLAGAWAIGMAKWNWAQEPGTTAVNFFGIPIMAAAAAAGWTLTAFSKLRFCEEAGEYYRTYVSRHITIDKAKTLVALAHNRNPAAMLELFRDSRSYSKVGCWLELYAVPPPWIGPGYLEVKVSACVGKTELKDENSDDSTKWLILSEVITSDEAEEFTTKLKGYLKAEKNPLEMIAAEFEDK